MPVSSFEQVSASVESIFEAQGKIDILFANAGVHYVGGIEQTDIETYMKVLNTHLIKLIPGTSSRSLISKL